MKNSITIHYAVQVCDTKSYQSSNRFCGDNRTLLSKKSLRSLIQSIEHAAQQHLHCFHHVMIVKDKVSSELNQFIETLLSRNKEPNVQIESHDLYPESGIVDSIRYCYKWLDKHGKNLVFQIQDDYLFCPTAILNSIDQFYIIFNELQTHSIIQPFNDITYWGFTYKNQTTPRLISLGKQGYWIQIYDTSCSFLTSHWQFRQHWDLYEKFFKLIPDLGKPDAKLENASLNYMFTQKGVLGLTPVNTLSHHMQTQPDLYVDWRPIWDSIDVDI